MECDHDWQLRHINDGVEFNRCKRCDVLMTRVHRPAPKPATPEPPLWMPIKTVTLEELKAKYPLTSEKCIKCALAWSPEHRCPSQVTLDAWRTSPDGSILFEYAPGQYSLHTPIKSVEVPTPEPPEVEGDKVSSDHPI